jgi:hypothetical protein
MHNADFCERYGLVMEEYLTHAGFHAVELQVQVRVVCAFIRASLFV